MKIATQLIVGTALISVSAGASASDVYTIGGPAQGPGYASPGNTSDWTLGDTRNGGTSVISTAQPRSGNGSLEMKTGASADKSSVLLGSARWFDTPVFGTLGALADGNLSFDIYRDSSSTVADHLAPAFQLNIQNAAGESANLKWEPIYNGYAVVPEDQWISLDITGGNFWMYDGQVRADFDEKLDDWVNGHTVGDSTVLGPDSKIVGISIQNGSGWTGEFTGYVDNVTATFDGGNTYAANFEVVPSPTAFGAGLVGLVGLAVRRRRG